jgi:hypothetical protein
MEGPEAASYRTLSLVQDRSFSDLADLVEGCVFAGSINSRSWAVILCDCSFRGPAG